MFERVHRGEVVLVAVNRGEDKTLDLPASLRFPPGHYTGLLADATEANQGNYLTVEPSGWVLHLNKVSSLVVHL